jgi:Fic family protein
LTKRGFDTKKFFALEEYYNEDRPAYYSALANANAKGGDLTEWLEYFLFGIAVEISRVEKTVMQLSNDRSLKEKIRPDRIKQPPDKSYRISQRKGEDYK